MAQQKSEDRVLLEGGVMPAERAGSSSGARGKAVPVDETTGQLCLPIVTAERRARVPDRSEDRGSVLPKAIVNAQIDASSLPSSPNWCYGNESRSIEADGGVRNPPPRGAVCDERKHGSVGAGDG